MHKSLKFLHAAVLTLTTAMAMEKNAPEEATAWNDLPPELQQDNPDEFAPHNQGWNNRIQRDFPGAQERLTDEENLQTVYKNLKEDWIIKGDFATVFDY